MSQSPSAGRLKYTSILEVTFFSFGVATMLAAFIPSISLAKAASKKVVYDLVPSDYEYLHPLLLAWYYPIICGLMIGGIFCLILLAVRQLLPPHRRHVYPLRPRDAVVGGWSALVMLWINYVLAVLFTGSFLLWSHSVSRPTPLWIPTTPPDETRRVTHPDGYSIVIDSTWRTDLKNDLSIGQRNSLRIYRSSLSVYPVENLGSGRFLHLWPFFSVSRYSERPYIADTMQSVEFQGSPAFEQFLPVDRKPPLQCGYELIFQRDDSWFRIAWYKYVSEQESHTLAKLPPMINRYIETFRYDSNGIPSDPD
ncbi:MAG: hypothetical protein KDA68_16080 [Planctomycetaceae bacterium]|nr:hypothetical protein [Planctomycetaceae bacterium]